jgi:hypothetical protein
MDLHENTLYRYLSEFKQDGKNVFPDSGQLMPTLIYSFIHDHRFKLRVAKMRRIEILSKRLLQLDSSFRKQPQQMS